MTNESKRKTPAWSGATLPKNKRPGTMAGPLYFSARRRRRSGRLFLGDGFLVRRLHAATRALGERRLDLLDRLGLGDALHRRDLARQPVERGFIELPLAVGLLRLGLGPVEVAHH